MAITPGKGSTLKNGTNLIGQIFDLKPPNMANPELDTTDLDSTVRTFRPTVPDYGEFNFKMNHDPADSQHQALLTAFAAGTVISWTVTLADAGNATYAFSGFIKGYDLGNLVVDNKSEATVTVKLTGSVTFTA